MVTITADVQITSFVDILLCFVATTYFMQGSPGIGTRFSSPTRFNEDDTIAGVFIGPRCDVEKEEDNLRRLQHALGDVQHELCAPSVNQSSTPSDVADQHLTEGENADALSPSGALTTYPVWCWSQLELNLYDPH